MVRVRFAPSPTGYLHVGGARTALFNWLYARRHGGAFVLRIEDTDAERSSWDMVAGIVDGLRWLGLDWDEGPDIGGPHAPYFQSERLDRYRAMADALVRGGRAYYCYCTQAEIQRKRADAEASGRAWMYDRACTRRSPEELAALQASGAPRAIRFLVPEGQTRFDDLVHGPIVFDNANIEDFVVLRSDGHPTYHLSVVADDVEMAITDVVRGDDHISNTPKQVLLYQAVDRRPPRFAHVPLILGPDKKRLSKRHGATSVMEYHRLGYLPEAMVNFLALLGWSPGGDRELFSRDELIAHFTLEGISGGNAVFSPEKLDWFNQQYIARLKPADLLARLEPRLADAGLWREEFTASREGWILSVLDLLKGRAKKLDQLVGELRPFLVDEPEIDPAAAEKHLGSTDVRELVGKLATRLESLQRFDEASIEETLRSVAEDGGVKAATLIHATRVAVTGRAVSASLFQVLALIGCDRVVARLRRARNYIPTP
ncbi:MAG TPA: glutamate--tRNA ligase [Vicinamibacterales bacterium]|nr:glutamate--tRNA ligase [Vicinamibacterales bacterium]